MPLSPQNGLPDQRLLDLSPERRAMEARRAQEYEESVRAADHARRRVLWQCVALTFAGVPFYAWSWHLTDPRQSELTVATAFLISYAAPFFRWLAHHVSESDSFSK